MQSVWNLAITGSCKCWLQREGCGFNASCIYCAADSSWAEIYIITGLASVWTEADEGTGSIKEPIEEQKVDDGSLVPSQYWTVPVSFSFTAKWSLFMVEATQISRFLKDWFLLLKVQNKDGLFSTMWAFIFSLIPVKADSVLLPPTLPPIYLRQIYTNTNISFNHTLKNLTFTWFN